MSVNEGCLAKTFTTPFLPPPANSRWCADSKQSWISIKCICLFPLEIMDFPTVPLTFTTLFRSEEDQSVVFPPLLSFHWSRIFQQLTWLSNVMAIKYNNVLDYAVTGVIVIRYVEWFGGINTAISHNIKWNTNHVLHSMDWGYNREGITVSEKGLLMLLY